MEPRKQKKRKRRHHHSHPQQDAGVPLGITRFEADDTSSKSRRKRKRRRLPVEAERSALPSARPDYTPHVGVDRTNSNWLQLQAILKKGRGGGKTRTIVPTEPDRGAGIAEEKPGNCASIKPSETLSPKNGDCSLTKVLAMDCEMVGAGLDGKRNILARVSLVNIWGNVVYDKHVKPLEQVTDYRTKVSGVRASNLKKGERFAVVQKKIAELILGRVLVGHSVRNDLKILYLSHPKKDIRDTAVYPPLRSSNGRPRALRHIASELLGVQIQTGEHCSIEDARAAMYIYQHLKRDWEALISRKYSKLAYFLLSKKAAVSAKISR